MRIWVPWWLMLPLLPVYILAAAVALAAVVLGVVGAGILKLAIIIWHAAAQAIRERSAKRAHVA